MPFPHRLALILSTLASALAAQNHQGDDSHLRRLSHDAQQRLLEDLRNELAAPADPYLTSMARLAAAARLGGVERTTRFGNHQGKRIVPADEAPDARLPQSAQYVFGVGTIDPLDGLPAPKPGDTGKPPAERLRQQRLVALQQAVRGIAPGADLALAHLLQQLDTEARGDRFAAFLHSWRNGPESFYEALDRTAGTADSVFFYDAMLGDFRSAFSTTAAELKSLQGAHDALHDAFLTYRQYRGFREAIAYALVLPPDTALPLRLQRYAAEVKGSYSLRQQVLMLRHLEGDDPERVVALALRGAVALPEPLWRGSYEPFAAWQQQFAAAQERMIAASGSTDAFLAAALAAARTAAERVATTAHRLLAATGRTSKG
jgi:hypothetical protein